MVGILSGVNSRWEAGASVDGVEIPPSPNFTPKIEIRSGIQRALPSLRFEFFDPDATVTEAIGGVKDGSTIEIAMGDAKGGPITEATFRVLGSPKTSLKPGGLYIEADAIADHIGWMKKVVDFHMPNVPASAMLAAMAGLAGLKPEIDITQDIQTWLPNRQPLSKYAEFILQRAHSGQGAMAMGVTIDSRLRVKTLSTLLSAATGGGVVFDGGIPDRKGSSVPYFDWQASGAGALQNLAAGYGMTTLGEKITGEKFEFNLTDIPSLGGIGSIGKSMQGILGAYGSRIASMGVDSGNTHPEYNKALHSNVREKATWSNDVDVMTKFATGLDLFDTAGFRPVRPQDPTKYLSAFAGVYVVTNTVRGIMDNLYFERVTMTNQG